MLKHQDGISMLETLLSLLVIGSIITMSVHFFALSTRNSKVLRTIELIRQITVASYDWLGAQRQMNFSGYPNGIPLSAEELQQAKLLPEHLINPWGGSVLIQPAANPKHFQVVLDNIPQKDCQNLVQRLKSSNLTVFYTLCHKSPNSFYGTF